MQLINFLVYLVLARYIGNSLAVSTRPNLRAIDLQPDQDLAQNNVPLKRDSLVPSSSRSLFDRSSKVTTGKGVEFSIFPKGPFTWTNKGVPKWKKNGPTSAKKNTPAKKKAPTQKSNPFIKKTPGKKPIPKRTNGKAKRARTGRKRTSQKATRTLGDYGTPIIEKRAQRTAEAGFLAQGGSADVVLTYNVKNCIAIGAYDRGTGNKVVAHINGIQPVMINGKTVEKTWQDQFDDFAKVVNNFSVMPEIKIRMPVVSDFRTQLSAGALREQETMQTTIEQWAVSLANRSHVVTETRKRYSGDMEITTEGRIRVDT